MFFSLISDAKRYSRTLISLARNDFQSRYVGSQLGIFWAFAHPLFTVLIFWFVFAVGMRTATVNGVPFLVWLMCGLVPWFYFSEAWLSSSNSLLEYSFLVKKIVFRVSFLPIIKVCSAAFVHLIFILILLGVAVVHGVSFSLATIQIAYYSIATTALILALSLITASVLPFFKDLRQIITIALQFGMWLTPIMWDKSRIPEGFSWVLYVNPMHYIVDGYRGSILGHEWFWEKPLETAIFWSMVSLFGSVGLVVYRRLRPEFADVL